MANKLSEVIGESPPIVDEDNTTEVIESSVDDIVEGNTTEIIESANHEVQEVTRLDNLSVGDILEKCQNEEVLSQDIPYENVRNNSKIFLIYFAKSQLQRVVKLSGYLEQLEDQLMANSEDVTDPDVIMRMIGTIQNSMMTAINLIDRVSTDDSYVKLVFNDNRQIINNLNQTTINASQEINLSKESRSRLRDLANSLLSQVDTAIENGGEFIEGKSKSTIS